MTYPLLDELMRVMVMCGKLHQWEAALCAYYEACERFGEATTEQAFYQLPLAQQVFSGVEYGAWFGRHHSGMAYLNTLRGEVRAQLMKAKEEAR